MDERLYLSVYLWKKEDNTETGIMQNTMNYTEES